jgi:enoyl-CoA hydratase
MPSSPLHITRDGLATTLTLALPAKRNALGPQMVEALDHALSQAFSDGTRLLVLRADGPSFCSGFDFSDLESQSDASLQERFRTIEKLLAKVYTAPIDTLALVHGAAVGAGADLVASCAHRIGDASAKLRFPGVGFGLVLGTRRLGTRIGNHAALQLIGARGVDAKAAFTQGLLTAVQEQDSWASAVTSLQTHIGTQAASTRALLLAALRDERSAFDLSLLEQSMQAMAGVGIKERIAQYLAAAS